MRFIRKAAEDEIILAFMSGELQSERFRCKLKKCIADYHTTDRIITQADLQNDKENRLRRMIFGDFRGYGQNRELFENYPNKISWDYAQCEADDLDKIRYMNYDYWNQLSQNTGLVKAAAETIRNGVTIFGVPNDAFLEGAKLLKTGTKFPPIILLTADDDAVDSALRRYILMEGHARMTAYGIVPEKFEESECYIGKCGKKELDIWNGCINNTD